MRVVPGEEGATFTSLSDCTHFHPDDNDDDDDNDADDVCNDDDHHHSSSSFLFNSPLA